MNEVIGAAGYLTPGGNRVLPSGAEEVILTWQTRAEMILQCFRECHCDNSRFSTMDCMHYRKAKAVFDCKPLKVVDGKAYWTIEEYAKAGCPGLAK